jgi:hypothetical protein
MPTGNPPRDHKFFSYGTTAYTDGVVVGVEEPHGGMYLEVNEVVCAQGAGTTTAADGAWHSVAVAWTGTTAM